MNSAIMLATSLGKESRPLKTRPHSAPTGAAFGFCYAPPLARDSESTND